jgi:chloramphenicol 3-O-phosphotransferase
MEELIRRQTERGDRFPDQAQWQTEHEYKDIPYDLTVDTSIDSIDECANKIIEHLKYKESWTSFREIKNKIETIRK